MRPRHCWIFHLNYLWAYSQINNVDDGGDDGDDDDDDDNDDEIHDYQTFDNHQETVEERQANTIYWLMWMGEVIEHYDQMYVFQYQNMMI